MARRFTLSIDETLEIDQAIVLLGPHIMKRTLEERLELWERFTRRVARGYQDCLADYLNDLSIRKILADAGNGVSASLKVKLDELLSEADSRFLDATVPIETGISLRGGVRRGRVEPPPVPENACDDVEVWYSRLPKRMGKELREDLTSHGFLTRPGR